MTSPLFGTAPLTARLEPWMRTLLADPRACQDLLATYGSPVNVHHFDALGRNVQELREVAAGYGVDFQIYLARKANKTLGAIDAARRSDCGVDVASLRELQQCLERGVPAAALIVSAAVKSAPLLRLALTHGVTLSLDNEDELAQVLAVLPEVGSAPVGVALRLAIDHPAIPATRFGLSSARWLAVLDAGGLGDRLQVTGLHFHLNGYDAAARARGITQALDTVVQLRARGHAPTFIDMGGGIPMSYLDSGTQWASFWAELAEVPAGDEALTWQSDRLGATGASPSPAVYPYFQELVRGPWLARVLGSRGEPADEPDARSPTLAERLSTAGVQLRCEPGRSLLDGCGLTLAEVAFTKPRSDGAPLVGLHMNRTQCRSTSADFLLDPILVQSEHPRRERTVGSGFLVGAYCIEEELLLRRRLEIPGGVAPGDMIAFPNTAGYLMHIVESASHQLPLAANVAAIGDHWVRDDIDDV